MNTIRQASDSGPIPRVLEEVSTDSIQLDLKETPERDVVSVIEEPYPFNQSEIFGTVEYSASYPDLDIRTSPEEYDFRFRTESGLFILEGEIKPPKARKIFSEINQSLQQRSRNRLLSVGTNRLGLWSFVFRGEDYSQIELRDVRGDFVEWDEIREMTKREIAHNYTLDRARIIFRHNGERINVSYEDGLLNFTGDVSPESQEYVVQLFETYVVSGHVIDEIE